MRIFILTTTLLFVFSQSIFAQLSSSAGSIVRAGVSRSADDATPYPVFDGGLQYRYFAKDGHFGFGIEVQRHINP